MSAFVYRCYDAEGDVIYVGCTRSPKTRERSHATNSSWWHEVTQTLYGEHPTELEALRVERVLIRSFQPKHNKQFTARFAQQDSLDYQEFGSRARFTTCCFPGCDGAASIANRDHLCDTHRRAKQRRSNGDDGSPGARGRKNLTDEQKAEIRRRSARLENPKDIARSLGITKSALFQVLKRGKATEGTA